MSELSHDSSASDNLQTQSVFRVSCWFADEVFSPPRACLCEFEEPPVRRSTAETARSSEEDAYRTGCKKLCRPSTHELAVSTHFKFNAHMYASRQ